MSAATCAVMIGGVRFRLEVHIHNAGQEQPVAGGGFWIGRATPTLRAMDMVIPGIVILVVTGVLIALVRSLASRPPPRKRRTDALLHFADDEIDLDDGHLFDDAGASDVGGDHATH